MRSRSKPPRFSTAVQRHVTAHRLVHGGQRVQATQRGLHLRELRAGDEVHLVEHDLIGEPDLLARLFGVGDAVEHMAGVHHGGDAVESRPRLHVLVHEEGLRHRARVREARGLDDDGVERALAPRRLPPHQPAHDADQVAAHGAADAAVVHLEHFLVGGGHEVVVDADLAELVDDHRVAAAVILGEDAVQERGLAGAEIAGEHGDGDGLAHPAHVARRRRRGKARVDLTGARL